MKTLAFRLKSGQLLKEELERRMIEADIKAGVLLSIVGALIDPNLRMAGATPGKDEIKKFVGDFEIVSGTGTFSPDGCHVHLSIASEDGIVFGGHLKGGCVVDPTVEVVIGILEDKEFIRKLDSNTGYPELEISET